MSDLRKQIADITKAIEEAVTIERLAGLEQKKIELIVHDPDLKNLEAWTTSESIIDTLFIVTVDKQFLGVEVFRSAGGHHLYFDSRRGLVIGHLSGTVTASAMLPYEVWTEIVNYYKDLYYS